MKLAAFLAVIAVAPLLGQEAASRTSQDGVYTAEQAGRGGQVYKQACAACHPLDWYRGDVMRPWDGAPLLDLYDVIATKMPPSNPGSLKRRQYVDVLAYVLSLNDMPTGKDELPTPPAALQKILIKWRNKP